jgi:hypothetical protein
MSGDGITCKGLRVSKGGILNIGQQAEQLTILIRCVTMKSTDVGCPMLSISPLLTRRLLHVRPPA